MKWTSRSVRHRVIYIRDGKIASDEKVVKK